ncbi:MAG TPA: winged helix-turn-helix domain-containing protein, partial [Pyrinomonadaceae bacterium]|nr:winged helix-turn-helix domain-containing protein [Pyrinomonadaceae bacterium]
EIVSREELLEKIWHETFVEEANITYTISLLRKSLGDKKFVQTLTKRGYRFTAEVRQISENSLTEIKENKAKPKSKRRFIFISAAIFCLILLTGFAYYAWQKPNAENIPIANRNIKTLAVLPFKNLDKDEDNSLSLGLTDSLISRLGSLKRWTIRPFSAVEKFGKGKKDSLQFGTELKCDAVLVGTFQTVENRLRVNIRLLDVRDGAQIWTQSFDETEADLFILQSNLATQVAGSLLEKLTDSDQRLLGKDYTENAEAYRAYLRGR